MALSKRVTGPRRCVVAFQIPNAVPIIDPAVNLEKSDLVAYKESLWDTKHIRFIEGESPTWFVIQPITRRQKEASEGLSDSQRATWYVRCGLINCENYILYKDDGQEDAGTPDRAANGSFGLMVTEDWINRVNFPQDHMLALFLMIHTLSEAQGPTLAASSKPSGAAE